MLAPGPCLDIFERLIAFPTVSRDPNRALIDHVAALLSDAGIPVELHPDADGRKASLFARIGPDGPGGLVLSGHSDVVPVDGQTWSTDPFRLTERNGRFYGRGTTDMKGFCAAAIEAMLLAARTPPRRPLMLALSHDEEIGCIGVRPMLAKLAAAGIRPDMVLVGEPTGLDVALGHKGKTALSAHCCGVAAHSALAPTGLNAIHLASDLVSAIRALQAEIAAEGRRDSDYDIPYTTLHAGIVAGGTVVNIVPDHCRLDFEIRNLAEDDPAAILERLFERAEVIVRPHRARFPDAAIEIAVTNTYPGLLTDRSSQAVRRTLAASGGRTLKVAYGTEGGLFGAALGSEVVVCGPGHMDQGHKPDEYVSAEQLQGCRTMLARMIEAL